MSRNNTKEDFQWLSDKQLNISSFNIPKNPREKLFTSNNLIQFGRFLQA